MKRGSSSPVPPPGGRSMAISVRASGMPVTVSGNSPSRTVRPCVSKPGPAKKAVTVPRSLTVMPA
jgi:hypothetical protein